MSDEIVYNTRSGRPPHRPPKRTPETLDKVVEGFRKFGTQVAAAGYAGVTPKAVINWRDEIEGFQERIDEARAEWEARRLQTILKASKQRGGWPAAAWMLERLRPETYALQRAAGPGKFGELGDSTQIPVTLAQQIQQFVVVNNLTVNQGAPLPAPQEPPARLEQDEGDDVIDIPALPQPEARPSPAPAPQPMRSALLDTVRRRS